MKKNDTQFTHLGLFEGIGGFSLAARWMGWRTVAYSEINQYCLKILARHFPNATSLGDIKTINFAKYANQIDIVTGGFPCQPFSLAGKRGGTGDERYLWGEMLRAIIEIQPPYVVAENVLGIISWGEGVVFEQVQIDLENQGYEVQAVVLPACGVDAPHRRYRTWFVAYSKTNRDKRRPRNRQKTKDEKRNKFPELEQFKSTSNVWVAANPNHTRQQECRAEQFRTREPTQNYGLTSKPSICRGDDGFPNRVDRIAALGNAIVPQLALQIFQTLAEIHTEE